MKSREFGTIATYNGSYAFIRPDAEDSKDVFAHASELPGPVHRGDRVAGYLRALGILKGRLPEIETLAHQLFHQRRIAA